MYGNVFACVARVGLLCVDGLKAAGRVVKKSGKAVAAFAAASFLGAREIFAQWTPPVLDDTGVDLPSFVTSMVTDLGGIIAAIVAGSVLFTVIYIGWRKLRRIG